MSRYHNVKTLLDLAENYDQERLIELLLDEDTDTEELAEDIAFVLISLWGLVPKKKVDEFKNMLTDEIVNHQIKLMFDE